MKARQVEKYANYMQIPSSDGETEIPTTERERKRTKALFLDAADKHRGHGLLGKN